MNTPPPNATEIIPTPTHPRQPHRDPLNTLLTINTLLLFATFAIWALLTHRDWLRLTDTIIAITALTASLRYLTTPNTIA